MKRIILFFLFCILVFACSQENYIINENNWGYYTEVSKEFLLEDNLISICNNKDKNNSYNARNYDWEPIDIPDYYMEFISSNTDVGEICKCSLYLNSNIINPQYMSDRAVAYEKGRILLKERLQDKNTVFYIRIKKLKHLFHNYLEDNSYIYIEDLALDTLSKEELYTLGFSCVKKLPFNNWYYTSPL